MSPISFTLNGRTVNSFVEPGLTLRDLLRGEGCFSVRFGSDDGIQVYLNGKLVHENRAARAVGPNTRCPAVARSSASPAASGPSGPITVRSIRCARTLA